MTANACSSCWPTVFAPRRLPGARWFAAAFLPLWMLVLSPMASAGQAPSVLMFPPAVSGVTISGAELNEVQRFLGLSINAEGVYQILPLSVVSDALGSKVLESYAKCSDDSCRRSISRIAMADFSLGLSISAKDGSCRSTATIKDVWRGKAEVVGSASSGCSAAEISAAMKVVAASLSGKSTVTTPDGRDAKAPPSEPARNAAKARTGAPTAMLVEETGFLTVVTNPVGATVRINGKQAGVAPYQDELPVGHYVVTATLDEFHHVARAEIDLDAGGKTLTLDVLPAFGTLEIKSSVQDAEVLIDGAAVGRTPFRDERFRSGTFTVEVNGDQFKPMSRKVVVSDGQTTTETFVLQARFGKLQFTCDPSGAAVYIDGRQAGECPLTADNILDGPHEVRMTKDLYEPAVMKVQCRGGETIPVDTTLEPDFGVVAVTSDPAGASILLDGVDTGIRTPGKLNTARTGRHEISAKLDGYSSSVSPITVKKRDSLDVKIAMTARLGVLSVMAQNQDGTPCQGTLRIDGETVGATPWKGSVLAVPHLVEVSCGQLRRIHRAVAGENSRTTVILKMGEPDSSEATAMAGAVLTPPASVDAGRQVTESKDAVNPVEEPVRVKSEKDDRPIYKKWWLWTIVGAVVAGAAAGVAAGLLVGGGPDMASGTVSR